jgi:NTE family protein
VLEELAATEVMTESGTKPLHHEIDVISSVSGGSFTSAYFGLRGDKIFEDFEERFLRKNIEGSIFWQAFNPLNWFKLFSRSYGRSDLAGDYYAKHIFDHAAFADMQRADAPTIVINSTDLGSGVRFPLVREYFNLICADLDEYPISRAVAASSAVPGLLSPLSLENYAGTCGYEPNEWLTKTAQGKRQSMAKADAEAIMNLMDREKRPWLHLVDGGITDNLGLRSYWTRVTLEDGLDGAFPMLDRPGGHQVLLILVNAITRPSPNWLLMSHAPSLMEIVGSVSSIELARYDIDTIELVNESFDRWAKENSKPGRPVSFDFVEVGFAQVRDDAKRESLNKIGTNFDLGDAEVDSLISAAREVLRESPEFQSFLERNRRAHTKP